MIRYPTFTPNLFSSDFGNSHDPAGLGFVRARAAVLRYWEITSEYCEDAVLYLFRAVGSLRALHRHWWPAGICRAARRRVRCRWTTRQSSAGTSECFRRRSRTQLDWTKRPSCAQCRKIAFFTFAGMKISRTFYWNAHRKFHGKVCRWDATMLGLILLLILLRYLSIMPLVSDVVDNFVTTW